MQVCPSVSKQANTHASGHVSFVARVSSCTLDIFGQFRMYALGHVLIVACGASSKSGFTIHLASGGFGVTVFLYSRSYFCAFGTLMFCVTSEEL